MRAVLEAKTGDSVTALMEMISFVLDSISKLWTCFFCA